jgi:hypothetical protein
MTIHESKTFHVFSHQLLPFSNMIYSKILDNISGFEEVKQKKE